MSNYFYGWYFRCQSKEETIAVIPAVHISEEKKSCSIQVITKERAYNQQFPIHQFQISRDRKSMRIGGSLFTRRGIRLILEDADVRIRGMLHFGTFTEPRYDIMGPFQWVPCMECRHAVYSMRHSVHGEVHICSKKLAFENGFGYMEGDSGISFPQRYVWTQHFFKDGSIVLAVAEVPLAGFRFMGCIGIVWWKGKEHRFATYLGASVITAGEDIWIRQGKYQLRIKLLEKKKNLLYAPSHGAMTRKIGENPSCHVEYLFQCKDDILFHVKTAHAAFECEME